MTKDHLRKLETTIILASQGDPNAQRQQGKIRAELRDKVREVDFFQQSESQGYSLIFHTIAEELANDLVFASNEKKKFELLNEILIFNQAAIRLNYLPAIYKLAESYRKGNWYVTREDIPQAIKLHRSLADSGYAPGQYALGIIYLDHHKKQGDIDFAIATLIDAANQGLKVAQKKLASIYAGGQPGVPQNISTAHIWLRRAENNKNTSADFD